MLNAEIKRQIDSARQILVGKVPDPKAQVEQITTALIYKFMDDMDRENMEVGLEAQFFIKEYKDFAWSKMMDKKNSGQSRLDLYVQAISQMPQNPYIPQLFRDIFKGAFLPFRDARTLNLFLKEINKFHYDHSENLGNAFEYLLSILGSQGDAGQFRTPRHIIDFIVSVIDPEKNETVLDPACGTAGFLISSYKHIMKNNSSQKNNIDEIIEEGETATDTIIAGKKVYSGDLLTPAEKIRLMKNINGYDISPDMVKLALVNLYLHGFKEPQIFEYDTLSDEKRWDEDYDVILANPPFMTPKGGIKPHKRFSVQANRAEVLFVDYIAEHLKIGGRAGIIVPEGIIFQSAKAYKKLRKDLLENWGLWAVISLPSGVFQPYSGVKTSILILDKALAKHKDDILFLKIENDGFDLGAQRRKIDKNDLPKALEVLSKWKSNTLEIGENQNPIFLTVKKSKIAENGDYNLTGDRYRETVDYSNVKWEMVELGGLLEEKVERVKDKDIQVWSVSNTQGFVNTEKYFEKKVASENTSNYKIINSYYFAYNPSRINVGSIAFNESENSGCVSPMYVVFEITNKRLNANYLFKILKSKEADKEINLKSQGAVRKQLRYKDLITIKIPLPPLEVQEQIVAEINQNQKVIDGAKQVVENWKPSFRIDPEWEMVELGEVCEVSSGNTAPQEKKLFINGKYPFYRTSDVGAVHLSDNLVNVRDWLNEEGIKGLKLFKKGTILFPKSGASTYLNHRVIMGQDGYVVSHLATISANEKLANEKYIYFILTQIDAKNITPDQAYPSLKTSEIKNLKIPLPPLEIQEQIVAEIEEEQIAIETCKTLIDKMQKKIEQKIAEVWGE
jgi:type I restriction enzyme M protein